MPSRFSPLVLACSIAVCLPLPALARMPTAPTADKASATMVVAPASDPARQALDAWLDAFNANDRARLEAFRDRYQPKFDVDGMLDFHQQTGGFRLLRREPAVAGSAQALVQEMESETVARVSVTLREDRPLELGIEAIERPADLRIARLDPAGAVAALAAKADADARDDRFSGVLLVAHGDDILLQRAWGLADRDAKTPVTPDTKLRLGSMDKMFTAVATLQLVQAGKLSLDGTVGQYLQGYPNADIARVTIRQLLTHAGGTGDIFGPEFDKQRLSLKTHDDYVRLYGSRGPTHPPGKGYEYSNYGFVLLGVIIEHASGQSYYDYVEQHVFAPAGMRDTGSLPEDVMVPGRAHAYTRKDGHWVDAADTLPWRGTAAGGGYSTAADLLRFARALQAGRLLSPELLAEATRKQTPWYGYGFMVGERQGVAGFGHGGGAEGMNGALEIFPAQGQVVIGLANVDPPEVDRLADYYSARMPLGK
jgi:CubicO group peptidase (beta-lactamase class C family)